MESFKFLNHRIFLIEGLFLTCWMWPLANSGNLLMICLMAELRESPTRALQARALIRSASVMGTFTDSRDRSTCSQKRGKVWSLERWGILFDKICRAYSFIKTNTGILMHMFETAYLYAVIILHYLPHVGQHPVVGGRGLLRMQRLSEGGDSKSTEALVRSAHTVYYDLR